MWVLAHHDVHGSQSLPSKAGGRSLSLFLGLPLSRMVDARFKANTRKREARLFTARTIDGFYVEVYVYLHETSFSTGEWTETGRSYRLQDGTQVHLGASGDLTSADTGELFTRV